LQGICNENEVDLLIPGVDEELLGLASVKGSRDWPDILLPDKAFVALMLDKLSSNKALVNAGLSAPKTESIKNKNINNVRLPCIVKPRRGRGSRGVMKLDSQEEVSAYLTIQKGKPEDYILQELIVGREYTVFVAADVHSRLRAVIPVKVDLKRGVTIRAETDNEPAIIDYVKKFQKCFKATSVYNIQCMLTEARDVIPFEINPRISTTFCLAISTGFDPIRMNEGTFTNIFTPQITYKLQRNWMNTITKH
jgi:carbamoyl-phosphate synthase large subunit